MKYSIRDLQDENKFTLLRILSLNDIVQFVFQQIRILNPITALFFLATILSFSSMVITLVIDLVPGQWGWGRIVVVGLGGFIFWPILLIPVHELMHAMVYKFAGAPKIKFGVMPKKYLFYVTADKFVIGRTDFILVALTPFIFISLLLIVLAIITIKPLSWSFVVCLFVHTTMCIGDFALAGFLIQQKQQEVYTFDDIDNGVTYFYKRN